MADKKVVLKDPISGDRLFPITALDSIVDASGEPWTPPESVDYSSQVYPVFNFPSSKVTNITDTTITETGPDYTIETSFISDNQIVQVLTYQDKVYTKTIDISDTTITETTEVTENGMA